MLARRLLTVATLALATVGVSMTSTVATASGSKCVALVVDFSAVGGSVSTACVTVPTNATGSDVLVAGHHKVTFDPRYGNDFVCAIDGVPADGCHATDDTHYWVYYHRAPGSTAWHVSQEGAGTYRPANTATEGWVYDDGHSPAPTPRDVPYDSICTKPQSSSRSASPTTRPATTTPSSVGPTATTAAPRRVAVSTTPARTPSSARTLTPSAAVSPPAQSLPSPVDAARVHRYRMYPVPFAVVIGVVIAVGLGAATIVRMRR